MSTGNIRVSLTGHEGLPSPFLTSTPFCKVMTSWPLGPECLLTQTKSKATHFLANDWPALANRKRGQNCDCRWKARMAMWLQLVKINCKAMNYYGVVCACTKHRHAIRYPVRYSEKCSDNH